MTRTATIAAAASTRRVQAVLAGMLITLLAVVSLAAWAQPTGGRMGHHGGGMDGMMMGGRMMDRMLDSLDATEAQRSQIKQIATAAAVDLKVQAEAGRALRERSMQVFTAPNVDANAVEQVRQQMLQQHDQMSRRMSLAMIDIARVLTPEQRARIAERMRDRQVRMQDRIKRMQERMGATPATPAPPR